MIGVLNSGAGSTLIYLRAVQLDNFSLTNILSGTQSYANYSFTEQSASLSLGSGAMSLTRPLTSQTQAAIKQTRTKFQLNKLFIK